MQSYLLRPDFFEKVNGMLEDNASPTTKSRPHPRTVSPISSSVPRCNNGEQLQAWAMSKGLPEAEVGMSTTEYYQLLCRALEKIIQSGNKNPSL
jgi:hypothetical protein